MTVVGQCETPGWVGGIASHPFDYAQGRLLKESRSGKPIVLAVLAKSKAGPPASDLTIEMRHASVIDGHEVVQILIADGQPRTVKETPRAEIETKAFWEKSSLVVVKATHQPFEPGRHPAVITSRWELSKDGGTLKSEVSTYGYSQNYVYEKQ